MAYLIPYSSDIAKGSLEHIYSISVRRIVATVVMKDSFEHRNVLDLIDQSKANVDLIGILRCNVFRLPHDHFSQKNEVRQLNIDEKIVVHVLEVQVAMLVPLEPLFMFGDNGIYNFYVFFQSLPGNELLQKAKQLEANYYLLILFQQSRDHFKQSIQLILPFTQVYQFFLSLLVDLAQQGSIQDGIQSCHQMGGLFRLLIVHQEIVILQQSNYIYSKTFSFYFHVQIIAYSFEANNFINSKPLNKTAQKFVNNGLTSMFNRALHYTLNLPSPNIRMVQLQKTEYLRRWMINID